MKKVVAIILVVVIASLALATAIAASHKHQWVFAYYDNDYQTNGQSMRVKVVSSCGKISHPHRHMAAYQEYRAYYKCSRCGIGKYADISVQNMEVPEECLGN